MTHGITASPAACAEHPSRPGPGSCTSPAECAPSTSQLGNASPPQCVSLIVSTQSPESLVCIHAHGQKRHPGNYFPAGRHNGKDFPDLKAPAASVRPGSGAGNTPKLQSLESMKNMNKTCQENGTDTSRSPAAIRSKKKLHYLFALCSALAMSTQTGFANTRLTEMGTSPQTVYNGYRLPNGGSITLSAKLEYRVGNTWRPLVGRKLSFFVKWSKETLIGTATTNHAGVASLPITYNHPVVVPSNGTAVGWLVSFSGEPTLNARNSRINGWRFYLRR